MEMKRSQSALGRLAKKVSTAFSLAEVQAGPSKTSSPEKDERDSRRISTQSTQSAPSSPGRRKSVLLRRPSFTSKKSQRKQAQEQLEGTSTASPKGLSRQDMAQMQELEGLMIRVGGSDRLSALADARQSLRFDSYGSNGGMTDPKGKGKMAVRPERPMSFYPDMLGPVPTAGGAPVLQASPSRTMHSERSSSLGPSRPPPPLPPAEPRSASIPHIHINPNTPQPIPYDPDDTHPDNFAPRRRVGSVTSLSTRKSHRYTPSQSSQGTHRSSRSRNQSITTFNSGKLPNPQPFRPEPQPSFPEPEEMPGVTVKEASPPMFQSPLELSAAEAQASHWSPSTIGEGTPPPQLPPSPAPVRHSTTAVVNKRQSVRSGIFAFNGDAISSGINRLTGHKPKKKKRAQIVVVGAQRIGAGRYAVMKEAANRAAALRKASVAGELALPTPTSRKNSVAAGRRPSVSPASRRPSAAPGRKLSVAPITARRGSTAGMRRGSSFAGERRRSSGTDGSRRTSLGSTSRKGSTASARKPSLTPTFPPPVFINSFATDTKRQQGSLDVVSLYNNNDDSVLYSILDEDEPWEDDTTPLSSPSIRPKKSISDDDPFAFVAHSPKPDSPDPENRHFESIPRRQSLAAVPSVKRAPEGHPSNHHARFVSNKIAELPRLVDTPLDLPPVRALTPTRRKSITRRASRTSVNTDDISAQRDSGSYGGSRRGSLASSVGAEGHARPPSQQKRRLSNIRLSIAEPRQEDIDAESHPLGVHATGSTLSLLSVPQSPSSPLPPPTPPKGPDTYRLSRKMSFPHSVGSTTNYSPVPATRSSRIGSAISFVSVPEDGSSAHETSSQAAAPPPSPKPAPRTPNGISWGSYSLQAPVKTLTSPVQSSDVPPKQTSSSPSAGGPRKIKRPPPPPLHKVVDLPGTAPGRRGIPYGTPSSSPSSLPPSDASTPGTSTFSSTGELSPRKLANGKMVLDARIQPLVDVVQVDLDRLVTSSYKRLSSDQLDPPSPALSRAPSTAPTFTMDDLLTPQMDGTGWRAATPPKDPPRYLPSPATSTTTLTPSKVTPPTPPKDDKSMSRNSRGLKLNLDEFRSNGLNGDASSPRRLSPRGSPRVPDPRYRDAARIEIVVTPSKEMRSFMDLGTSSPATPSHVESALQNFDFTVPESPYVFDPSSAFSPTMSPPSAMRHPPPAQRERVPVVDRPSPPSLNSATSSPKDVKEAKAKRRLTPQWAYEKLQTALVPGHSSLPNSPRSPSFAPHSSTPPTAAQPSPKQSRSSRHAPRSETERHEGQRISSSTPSTPTGITFRGVRSPFEVLERSESPKPSRLKEKEREKEKKRRSKERIGPEASTELSVSRLGAATKRGYDKVEIRDWLLTQRRDSATSLSGGK